MGSTTYVLSLVLLAECKRYYQFMLVYGVLAGISSAFLTTTALAVVAHWFEKKRGLASGIAFVGSSLGGIMFPLVLKGIFGTLSWAWSIRIVALIVGVMMIVGNLCVKGRLPPRKNGGAVDLRCFQDARFSWATVGVSCKLSRKRRLVEVFLGFNFQQASNSSSSALWVFFQLMPFCKVSAVKPHLT